VGRLAGLPAPVLRRARQLLRLLEGGHLVKQGSGGRVQGSGEQLGLFETAKPHPVVEKLKEVDVDGLTPRQALELIARLAEEARE
jgi:DNA mismatch repair protein MutS